MDGRGGVWDAFVETAGVRDLSSEALAWSRRSKMSRKMFFGIDAVAAATA